MIEQNPQLTLRDRKIKRSYTYKIKILLSYFLNEPAFYAGFSFGIMIMLLLSRVVT